MMYKIYSTIIREDEVNIVVNVFLGGYSTILTEPEVNNCFSIYTWSDLSRIGKETIEKNDYFDWPVNSCVNSRKQ